VHVEFQMVLCGGFAWLDWLFFLFFGKNKSQWRRSIFIRACDHGTNTTCDIGYLVIPIISVQDVLNQFKMSKKNLLLLLLNRWTTIFFLLNWSISSRKLKKVKMKNSFRNSVDGSSDLPQQSNDSSSFANYLPQHMTPCCHFQHNLHTSIFWWHQVHDMMMSYYLLLHWTQKMKEFLKKYQRLKKQEKEEKAKKGQEKIKVEKKRINQTNICHKKKKNFEELEKKRKQEE